MKFKILAAAGFVLASLSGQSLAAPVTFFGEDVNGPPNNDPNQAPFTNAEATRNTFFTNLNGVGTENFDSFASTPTTLTFPGAGTATLSGSANLGTGNDGNGRYPHSGNQYLTLQSADFTVAFNNPGGIAAFGFFTTDIGDFGGHLTLTLTDLSNVVTTLTVPNTADPTASGQTSGSNFYFGFYDTGNTYKQIVFSNDSGGNDVFGFDDMSVGSLQQVTPNATPLPAALPLFASGAGVLGFLGWRRKRKVSA